MQIGGTPGWMASSALSQLLRRCHGTRLRSHLESLEGLHLNTTPWTVENKIHLDWLRKERAGPKT